MAKGSSGRYRSRYGKRIRDKISEIEEGQKSSYACPECGEETVVREAKGIWKCKKCGEKFANSYQYAGLWVGVNLLIPVNVELILRGIVTLLGGEDRLNDLSDDKMAGAD